MSNELKVFVENKPTGEVELYISHLLVDAKLWTRPAQTTSDHISYILAHLLLCTQHVVLVVHVIADSVLQQLAQLISSKLAYVRECLPSSVTSVVSGGLFTVHRWTRCVRTLGVTSHD